MLALTHKLDPVERAVDAACGAVLAEDVVVAADLPARPTAYADGWAVNAEELVGATNYSTAILAPPPGWVEASDVMPPGTDAVLPPEAVTTAAPGMAEASDGVAPGHGVRNTGADIRKGTLLVGEGTMLAARHIGLLAACGVEIVSVRAPRARLVMASAAAGRHAGMVRLWLEQAGANVADVVHAHGDRAKLAGLYGDGTADLVVSVGGTGQGRKDRAVAALIDAGTLGVQGIALRPGGHCAFGEAGGAPVLLLPGRLDALIASWLALVVPALEGLAGHERTRWSAHAELTAKASSVDRLQGILPRAAGRRRGQAPAAGGGDVRRHRPGGRLVHRAAGIRGLPGGPDRASPAVLA